MVISLPQLPTSNSNLPSGILAPNRTVGDVNEFPLFIIRRPDIFYAGKVQPEN